MIIFIACTKQKKIHPCRAREMYTPSALFRGGYKYALSLRPDSIYILSAKYGLLHPETIIEPYEKTLISAKTVEVKKWSAMVYKQLLNEVKQGRISFNDKAVFLCGKPYRKYIECLFKSHEAPLSHLGIGQQLKFYKENT